MIAAAGDLEAAIDAYLALIVGSFLTLPFAVAVVYLVGLVLMGVDRLRGRRDRRRWEALTPAQQEARRQAWVDEYRMTDEKRIAQWKRDNPLDEPYLVWCQRLYDEWVGDEMLAESRRRGLP